LTTSRPGAHVCLSLVQSQYVGCPATTEVRWLDGTEFVTSLLQEPKYSESFCSTLLLGNMVRNELHDNETDLSVCSKDRNNVLWCNLL